MEREVVVVVVELSPLVVVTTLDMLVEEVNAMLCKKQCVSCLSVMW